MLAQRNSYVFTGKQGVVFNMSGTHLASFFIGYNIKQSWLVLFNGGSGVHLQFMGEQWAGTDIDWNKTMCTDPQKKSINKCGM